MSKTTTKPPLEGSSIFDSTPDFTCVPKEMKMDFSRFIDKPIPVTTFTWTTGQSAGTEIASLGFPSTFFVNKLASAGFDLASLFHARACFELQVAGTPMHAGALICAVMPSSIPPFGPGAVGSIHNYQSSPHTYLYASSSSVGCVEIPWYSTTKLRYTPSSANPQTPYANQFVNGGSPTDYATLRVKVLGALAAPTSGSTSLVVTVVVRFLESNFFMPKVYSQSSSAAEVAPPAEQSSHELQALLSSATLQDTDAISKLCGLLRNPIVVRSLVGMGVIESLRLLKELGEEILDLLTTEGDVVFQSSTSSMVSKGVKQLFTGVIDNAFTAAKDMTTDFLDYGRGVVRAYTGLHNPNLRNPNDRAIMATRNNPNYVDRETWLYKLDPYAQHYNVLDRPIGATKVDEGEISYLVSKNMAVSSFSISTTTTAGTLLFSAPIHPLMFRGVVSVITGVNASVITAPIDKLSRLSKFYRGGLVLSLQNLGSSFHMFKLLVVREYYSSSSMLAGGYAMPLLVNSLVDVLEFSTGGQVHEVQLPMASIFDHIPISTDPWANCASHGKVSVFLWQPMVVNGTVATSINVVAHVRGAPDFQLFGYATDNYAIFRNWPITLDAAKLIAGAAKSASFLPLSGSLPTIEEVKEEEQQLPQEPLKRGRPKDQSTYPYVVYPQSSEAGEVAPTNVPQNPKLVTSQPSSLSPHCGDFRPIIHLRDHYRRFIPLRSAQFTPSIGNQGVFTVPVSELVFGITANQSPTSIISYLATMFNGFRGGFKLKVQVRGASNAKVIFRPPTAWVNGNTSYVNGSSDASVSGNSALALSWLTKVGNFQGIGTYGSGYGSQACDKHWSPYLEVVDHRYYANSFDSIGLNGTGETTTDILAIGCELECEVPYMNPCEFVAPVAMFTQYNASSPLNYTPVNYLSGNLGIIIISVDAMYNGNPGSATSYPGPVVLDFFVGLDDTAHFVQQAASLPLIPLAYNVSGTGYVYDSNGDPLSTVPAPSIGLSAIPAYSAGSAI